MKKLFVLMLLAGGLTIENICANDGVRPSGPNAGKSVRQVTYCHACLSAVEADALVPQECGHSFCPTCVAAGNAGCEECEVARASRPVKRGGAAVDGASKRQRGINKVTCETCQAPVAETELAAHQDPAYGTLACAGTVCAHCHELLSKTANGGHSTKPLEERIKMVACQGIGKPGHVYHRTCLDSLNQAENGAWACIQCRKKTDRYLYTKLNRLVYAEENNQEGMKALMNEAISPNRLMLECNSQGGASLPLVERAISFKKLNALTWMLNQPSLSPHDLCMKLVLPARVGMQSFVKIALQTGDERICSLLLTKINSALAQVELEPEDRRILLEEVYAVLKKLGQNSEWPRRPETYAVEQRWENLVQLLLSDHLPFLRLKGLLQTNGFGASIWHLAIMNGHTEFIRNQLELLTDEQREYLSESGTADRDYTPLMVAAHYPNVEIIEVLLQSVAATKRAALINEESSRDGKTALDFAREKGHTAVVDLLERYLREGEEAVEAAGAQAGADAASPEPTQGEE